jgi:magnesium transporter
MSAVAQMHVEDPVKTPVTFILHRKYLVTVRYDELSSFTAYTDKARRKGGVTIATPQGIMIDIIEAFINRMADSLETISGEIDVISRDIFRQRPAKLKRKTMMLQSAIRKIGAKGDLLNMVRESLASISRLLSHHMPDDKDAASKPVRARMGTLQRDVSSLIGHAGFLSSNMSFLLDATLGMINVEQNQIIKIFSIAAVVFLPPTLVASIYGMNFNHMPELSWVFGYPMALLLMLISALIPILYFRRKGWL